VNTLLLILRIFGSRAAALVCGCFFFTSFLQLIAAFSLMLKGQVASEELGECPRYVYFNSYNSIEQGVLIGRIVLLGSVRNRFTYDYVKAALPFIDRSLKYEWKHPDVIEQEAFKQRLDLPSGFSLAYGGNAIEVKSEKLRDHLYGLGLVDSSVSSADFLLPVSRGFSMSLQFDPQSCLLVDLQAFDGANSRPVQPIYPRDFVVELINSQVDNKI